MMFRKWVWCKGQENMRRKGKEKKMEGERVEWKQISYPQEIFYNPDQFISPRITAQKTQTLSGCPDAGVTI